MAFQELLRVRSVKYVEQKAFDGGVSHRGFPGCVDCRPAHNLGGGVDENDTQISQERLGNRENL